jgi:uncharacterized membrane protein
VDLVSWLSDLFGITAGFLSQIPLVRAGLAITLVFLLPGFAWTLVLFRTLNVIERGVLSIGLSIALVALSVILANYVLHVRITGANAAVIIMTISALPLTIYFVRRWSQRRRRKSAQQRESSSVSLQSL